MVINQICDRLEFGITMPDLAALSDEGLERFEHLLNHWQQLAYGEQCRREVDAQTRQAVRFLEGRGHD